MLTHIRAPADAEGRGCCRFVDLGDGNQQWLHSTPVADDYRSILGDYTIWDIFG